MKKKNLILLSLLLATVFLFNSCVSSSTTYGPAKTLDEAHPDRIEKTVIGMSIDDFKTIWPEAKRSGITENGETYEFIYAHSPLGGYMNTYDYKIFAYFYFTNNKLVKYESYQKTGF